MVDSQHNQQPDIMVIVMQVYMRFCLKQTGYRKNVLGHIGKTLLTKTSHIRRC